MDELLSLMEEGSAGPAPTGGGNTGTDGQPSSSSSGGGTGTGSSTGTSNRSGTRPSSSSSTGASSTRQLPNGSQQQQKQRSKELATVDPLTQLRIINRRTSRFDLSDALSPLQFATTSRLASMSLRDLGGLVTVPSQGGSHSSSNDGGDTNHGGGGQGFTYGVGPAPNANAFTGGKTNCATMGVLFSNSGTKVSPNTGRAYSIFQLGDLRTGPSVSVFLFGDAYSRHTGNGAYSGRRGRWLPYWHRMYYHPRGDTKLL